jgi:hypothetical protein
MNIITDPFRDFRSALRYDPNQANRPRKAVDASPGDSKAVLASKPVNLAVNRVPAAQDALEFLLNKAATLPIHEIPPSQDPLYSPAVLDAARKLHDTLNAEGYDDLSCLASNAADIRDERRRGFRQQCRLVELGPDMPLADDMLKGLVKLYGMAVWHQRQAAELEAKFADQVARGEPPPSPPHPSVFIFRRYRLAPKWHFHFAMYLAEYLPSGGQADSQTFIVWNQETEWEAYLRAEERILAVPTTDQIHRVVTARVQGNQFTRSFDLRVNPALDYLRLCTPLTANFLANPERYVIRNLDDYGMGADIGGKRLMHVAYLFANYPSLLQRIALEFTKKANYKVLLQTEKEMGKLWTMANDPRRATVQQWISHNQARRKQANAKTGRVI